MMITNGEVAVIRSFVYLDSSKLRSLSSQLFEGITDSIVKSTREYKEDAEEQKGPMSSGRILANIFHAENLSASMTFLEDHAYTLFERELINKEKLSLSEGLNNVSDIDRPFVKVTGQLLISDVNEINKIVTNFNLLGESIWRIQHTPVAGYSKTEKPLNDTDVKAKARSEGLQIDHKFAAALGNTLQYGYGDTVEAQIIDGELLYSAPLDRSFLREPERLLIQKYARFSQAKFSMMGLVTQKGTSAQLPSNGDNATNMKEALAAVTSFIDGVERSFFGRSHNEVVIDPIAIYIEV